MSAHPLKRLSLLLHIFFTLAKTPLPAQFQPPGNRRMALQSISENILYLTEKIFHNQLVTKSKKALQALSMLFLKNNKKKRMLLVS
jgi:hypothetical protein